MDLNDFKNFISDISHNNIQLAYNKINDHFPFSILSGKNITINDLKNIEKNNNMIKFKFKNNKNININLRKNRTFFSLSFDTVNNHYKKMKEHVIVFFNRIYLNISDNYQFFNKIKDNKYDINILPHEPSYIAINNNNKIEIKLCNCVKIMKSNRVYNLFYDYNEQFNDNNKMYKMISCTNIDPNINLLDIDIIKNIINNYNPYFIKSKLIYNGNNNYIRYYINKIYEPIMIINNYIIDNDLTEIYLVTEKIEIEEQKGDILLEFDFLYPFNNKSEYIKELCKNGLGLTINFVTNNIKIYKIKYK